MGLTAMMRLVVEPVIERQIESLGHIIRSGNAAVADCAGQPRIVEAFDVGYDAIVFRFARRTKILQGFVQDGVEPLRGLPFAREATHPDPIGRQQVIEGAMHRLEEGAAIGAIVGIGELGRRIIEPSVGPGVVGGELSVMRFHDRIVARSAGRAKID